MSNSVGTDHEPYSVWTWQKTIHQRITDLHFHSVVTAQINADKIPYLSNA